MRSQIKLLALVLVSFSIAFIHSLTAFSQSGNLTIKGNIKLAKEYDRDVDECFFHYKDVLSDKAIIIPIRRDSSGNFSVSMQLDTYQQIYFSKVITVKGELWNNTGMIYFSFFGKPGQVMTLNYTQKPFLLNFKGDFSLENNQYQAFVTAQQSAVKNLYGGIENSKFTPAQVKERALTNFKDRLTFNRQYFKEHPAPKFVQEQAYFNALYDTQGAAIQLNFLSKNEVTEDMVSEFYKSMNSTGKIYKDGPNLNLKNVFDPNPSLKNAGAIGNRDYKDFISDYFQVLRRNMPVAAEQTVLFKDLATYLIKKYPDLKSEDRLIVTNYLNETAKHSDEETKAMTALSNRYSPEFLQVRENQAEIAYYLALKDPALRDIGATIALYKQLDFNHIDYLEPAIEDYKKGVQNTYLKNRFLADYKTAMDKLHNSKVPELAVLQPANDLGGPELLTKLLEKYKGKVVYLDVWATWCGPCIAGMEASQKLREKLKGKNVVFVYLCMDSPNETSWKNIIAAKHMEGENYFLDKTQSSILGKTLNISAVPLYVVVDQQGKIVDPKAPAPLEPATLNLINDLLGK